MFEPIRDALFKEAHREGRKEPVEAYAFDALIEMARRASGQVEGGAPKASAAPQLLGLVRVDHAALVRGKVDGEEVCEIAGLGPIPVRVARELLGDAVVKLVITKGVDVMNVTHLGRGPTVAQKMALCRNAEAFLCLLLAAHTRVEDCQITRAGHRFLHGLLLRRQHGPTCSRKPVT